MNLASLAGNLLPGWLPQDSPFHPWDVILAVCLLACVPRATRRWGAVLFIVTGGVLGLSLFVNYAYASFIPN